MIDKNKKSTRSLPWLVAAQKRIRTSMRDDRLSHALLVHAPRGVGADRLALWTSQLALCAAPGEEPCNTCSACQLFAAGTHPDFHWLERAEDAQQLQVGQIRELCDVFALKSYRGGRKVGVIASADLMNASAANALLKTLEEPPPDALLILISERPSRLPATVVSRCQRIMIAVPPRAVALEWLAQEEAVSEWSELLDFAGGAPLRALELHANGFEDLHRDMRVSLQALQERALDIPATAERWARDSLEGRLAWIETWITKSLREAFLRAANLQSLQGIRKIRRLYGLLDRIQAFKLELGTSLNMQLAAEELLLYAEDALTS